MKLTLKPRARIQTRAVRYERRPHTDPQGYARAVLQSTLLDARDVRLVYQRMTYDYQHALGRTQQHQDDGKRGVVKLSEYAWLLGQDGLARQMAAAPKWQLTPYGAPALRMFAIAMRLPFPGEADNARLWRMGQGQACELDCDQGCPLPRRVQL